MPTQNTLRTVEFKLYPNSTQIKTLGSWLRRCCFLYNRALEQRIKAYNRRGESVTFYDQCKWITKWRERNERMQRLPLLFARDSLRRVDRGIKAFFRRMKAGEKPGFPRFRSHNRYNSLEHLESGNYVGERSVRIPKIGAIKARGQFGIVGEQKLLRVIRRASGWYAQILIAAQDQPPLPPAGGDVGIDLGLESFLTTDSGEHIGNPRHLRKSAKRLKRSQQRLSKCKRGSRRRKKSVNRVARLHESIARQRKGFCHRISRELVNRFDRIAIEDLNIKGLAGGMLAKSVLDACWGFFTFALTYKAESAGRELVFVNPAGTSQECPDCGHIRKKELSEREHDCSSCGLRCHRDHAAAMVVLQRAFRPVRGGTVRLPAMAAGPMNRRDDAHH